MFTTAYLDNILVYSGTEEEHIGYIIKILTAMKKADLQVKTEKSFFYIREIKYLGFIITLEGIRIDPIKVKVI